MSNELVRSAEKIRRFEDALSSVFDKIKPFCVRETKQTANIHLPEKHISTVLVQFESHQAEIYDRFRRDFAVTVVRGGKPLLDDADEILKRLLRLVQVASPRLVDDSYRQTPGKFPLLVDLLEKAFDQGEKAIVWTAFTGNVDWLARELRKFEAVRVHGKLSHDDRNPAIKRFKSDNECMVLVAPPASAKEGPSYMLPMPCTPSSAWRS